MKPWIEMKVLRFLDFFSFSLFRVGSTGFNNDAKVSKVLRKYKNLYHLVSSLQLLS